MMPPKQIKKLASGSHFVLRHALLSLALSCLLLVPNHASASAGSSGLLTNPGSQSFDEEQSYTINVTARPGARVFVSGMPPGMQWDEVNRRFDFRPDFIQGGKSWQVTMEAVDGSQSETQIFTVTVNNTIQPPWPTFVSSEDLYRVTKLTMKQITDDFLDSPGYAGREFTANLAIPTKASAINPLPVRIGLHGFGGSPGTVGREGYFGVAPHDPNNTWWTGYNEWLPAGDRTSGSNPDYTQRRVMHLLSYLLEGCPGLPAEVGSCPGADPERVVVSGQSMGGTGALFLAINYGRHFTEVLPRIGGSTPHFLSPGQQTGLSAYWGSKALGLPGDHKGSNVWDLYDASRAALNNQDFRNLHFSTISGKNDPVISFDAIVSESPVTAISFLSALQQEKIGHLVAWDQRAHTGQDSPLSADWWKGQASDPASFLRRDLAFPAFSNGSADDDAGAPDGMGGYTGALRGAINRYLRWDSANIIDTRHQLSISIRVDINTTGTPPALDYPPADNDYFGQLPITTDITIRRIQQFQVLPGEAINWSYDGNAGTVYANDDGSVTVAGIEMATNFTPLILTRAAAANVIVATPATYRALLNNLQPGDTLRLEAGTYDSGLPLSDLHGEPGKPITITGPESGAPALFLGSQNLAWNTVQIRRSSYLTIRNLKLDGLDVPYIDAVNASGITHHITLENLEIVRHGAAQSTIGIATRGPAWDWIIRNCKIIGAGTGMYLGDPDGENWPFVGGLIEHNLIVDTVGYNAQIKQMNSRAYGNGNPIPGMPLDTRNTIIRHNVFSKAIQPTTGVIGPRPNLLVGHFPLNGPGSDDVYEIYGNFFYENTNEALFQGEGNIALYDNLLLNSSGSALNIQPHNDLPRSIDIFHNTIVSIASGIRVRGVNTDFTQRVIGNAVFSGTAITADSLVEQQNNVTAAFASASDYLQNPSGNPNTGELSFYPIAGQLQAGIIDMTAFQNFTDWNRDFNGDPRTARFRGAYAGDGINSGWTLAVAIKPYQGSSLTMPNIVTHPAPVTITEGRDATFNITATGSAPLSYQWLRNGNAIVGATNISYTVAAASVVDNSRIYSIEVSNNLGSVVSNGAELTVLPDTTAPTLAAVAAASSNRVNVIFSEMVSISSAENSANYQLDLGITVTAATLSGDGRTVNLDVTPLMPDTTYTLSVSNVQDRALTPNTIATLSDISFTYRLSDGFEDGNADGWLPLNADRWEVTAEADGNRAYALKATGFGSPGGGRLGEYSLLPSEYGDFTFTAKAKLGSTAENADYAVLFGYQNADNYYYVMFNNNQNYTQLFKVVNGTRAAALATATQDWLNDNAYHNIEVSRAGNAITVKFDGNVILSANDNSLGAGRVGVGSFNDAAYFDDVSLSGAATSTPDTTPPVITLIGDNPLTIMVESTYVELGAIASDNRDGNLSASITIDASQVNTAETGNYSVTYNVSDAAGNAAIQVTRTINVVATTATISDPSNDNNSAGSGSAGGGGALGWWGLALMLGFLRMAPSIQRLSRESLPSLLCRV